MTPIFKLLSVLLVVSILTSCKKEKTGDLPADRFIGLWVENSVRKDTLVVTKGENGNATNSMLFLHSNGKAVIPFSYQFNITGDSITLINRTDNQAESISYKITLSNQTFTINKFYSSLPEGNPLSFYKVR